MTAPSLTQLVLTRAERHLLARVHGWARRRGPSGYWPVWERGLLPGMWETRPQDGPWISIAFGPNCDHRMSVEIKTGRWGEQLLHETVTPRTVREAVDVLVGFGVLPAEFASAYLAGYLAGLRRKGIDTRNLRVLDGPTAVRHSVNAGAAA